MTHLLLPLVECYVSVPSGAPVVVSPAITPGKSTRAFLLQPEGHGFWVAAAEYGYRVHRKDVSLDLSPPPFSDGLPTRVDGADVLAGMVAFGRWGRLAGSSRWFVTDGQLCVASGRDCRTYWTLAALGIDPDHEHAGRLALIAISRKPLIGVAKAPLEAGDE